MINLVIFLSDFFQKLNDNFFQNNVIENITCKKREKHLHVWRSAEFCLAKLHNFVKLFFQKHIYCHIWQKKLGRNANIGPSLPSWVLRRKKYRSDITELRAGLDEAFKKADAASVALRAKVGGQKDVLQVRWARTNTHFIRSDIQQSTTRYFDKYWQHFGQN